MADTLLVLLLASSILFFGAFAEYIFKHFKIPDVLLLMALGLAIGPYGLNLVEPSVILPFAGVFTTFALLFLIYDGAFNIDLSSFARGITKSAWLTVFNFTASVIVISSVMLLFKNPFLLSILSGFMLGGVSSAFVIPILNQLKIKDDSYSVLAIESAMTDVISIALSLAIIEVILLQTFSIQHMLSSVAAMFAVAAAIGIVAGVVWIFLFVRFFRQHVSYMLTIAYVIFVYVISEFSRGNGAIACLFLGLVLKNSKQLTNLFHLVSKRRGEKVYAASGVAVAGKEEQAFYDQISFFLKTFFFVYIGILLDFSDHTALLIAIIISLLLMAARNATWYVTNSFCEFSRHLMSSIFARGLAAAAIAQVLVINGIEGAALLAKVTYSVILFTILFSSIRIFLLMHHEHSENQRAAVSEANPGLKG